MTTKFLKAIEGATALPDGYLYRVQFSDSEHYTDEYFGPVLAPSRLQVEVVRTMLTISGRPIFWSCKALTYRLYADASNTDRSLVRGTRDAKVLDHGFKDELSEVANEAAEQFYQQVADRRRNGAVSAQLSGL